MNRNRLFTSLSRARSIGFTLIELIFVMAIICIVLAITAPEFSGFLSGQNTANVTNKLVALARHGRASAISEGRVYRLNVDPTKNEYWLDAQVGGDFKELGTSNGQHFQIPDGIKVQWTAETGGAPASATAQAASAGAANAATSQAGFRAAGSQASTVQCVQFFPDGRSDMLTLKVTGKNGADVELGAPSECEMWRVAKDGQP